MDFSGTYRSGLLVTALGLGLGLGPNMTADAGTAQASFTATAVVNNTCSFSVGTLTLPAFTTPATQEVATTVSYTCTAGVAPILYNGGSDHSHPSTSGYFLRKTDDFTQAVIINLLRGASGDDPLGDSSETGWGLTTSNGFATEVQIRGKVTTYPYTAAGTYTATIPLVLSYPS
jgi:spore coat protein U-like protein